jgi:hypothetical protein
MRIPFAKLFSLLPDGSFSPLSTAEIKGIPLKPGLWIGEGVNVPGVDLAVLRGRDLEVDLQQGTYTIRGAY